MNIRIKLIETAKPYKGDRCVYVCGIGGGGGGGEGGVEKYLNLPNGPEIARFQRLVCQDDIYPRA